MDYECSTSNYQNTRKFQFAEEITFILIPLSIITFLNST